MRQPRSTSLVCALLLVACDGPDSYDPPPVGATDGVGPLVSGGLGMGETSGGAPDPGGTGGSDTSSDTTSASATQGTNDTASAGSSGETLGTFTSVESGDTGVTTQDAGSTSSAGATSG